MKITVRLVSIGGDVDATPRERDVDDGTSVDDIAVTLGLSGEETYAVLVNDMPIPPAKRAGHILYEGDRLTVFPPIRGG